MDLYNILLLIFTLYVIPAFLLNTLVPLLGGYLGYSNDPEMFFIVSLIPIINILALLATIYESCYKINLLHKLWKAIIYFPVIYSDYLYSIGLYFKEK